MESGGAFRHGCRARFGVHLLAPAHSVGREPALDILHLAMAVHLRATEFLTFNARQKKLARHAGYTLDLDSTKLLHEDGHQEGVTSGFTRQGIILNSAVGIWRLN